MSTGRWMLQVTVCGLTAAILTGCVGTDQYMRLQQQNRQLVAERQPYETELYDVRTNNNNMQMQIDTLKRELSARNEMLANLRSENEVLSETYDTCKIALTQVAGRQELGNISITGPKLPQPLDNALRQLADQHRGEVMYDPNRGTLKWKSDLLFPFASDVVRGTTMDGLRALSEIFKSSVSEGFEIIVVGHTDDTPIVNPQTKAKHPTNWHLSAHRAIAVADVLLKNGCDQRRISVMGCGEHRPVASNRTPDGAGQNRRVEIYLVPVGAIVTASAAPTSTQAAVAGPKTP